MTSAVVYGIIVKTVGLRLDEEQEFAGPDLAVHSIHAYPEDYVK